MPFWQIYYHVVWATKRREPLLDDDAADVVARVVKTACREQGVIVHAVGLMPDHVHVVASAPPALGIAIPIGRWKGSSSHLLNHAECRPDRSQFAWQADYGVLTFGKQAFAKVVDYTLNQRERHVSNRLWPLLERIEEDP